MGRRLYRNVHGLETRQNETQELGMFCDKNCVPQETV